MTCTQSIRLFVERGPLTDSQVLIKAAFSFLCCSAPGTGGTFGHPGVINQQQLKIFILNYDGVALPHCCLFGFFFFPSSALSLARDFALGLFFSVRLVANAALLSVRLPPLSMRSLFLDA